MIRSFRDKGLARFWETGNAAGIKQSLAARARDRLVLLNEAPNLEALRKAPSLRLRFRDNLGCWSIDVSGPWRILFEWRNGDAYRVALRQPH